ncbi:MAG: hypothetical protein CW346_06550 [Bacillaceae bacterium]|nr:hypothetical protein [Bacillaceae bacterium]
MDEHREAFRWRERKVRNRLPVLRRPKGNFLSGGFFVCPAGLYRRKCRRMPRQDMGVTGRGRGPGALPACREDLFAGDPEPSGFSVSPFPGNIP